jgi:hypothetical protein
MMRCVLASLLMVAITALSLVAADDPDNKPAPKDAPGQQNDNEAIDQERMAQQFRDFQAALLHLAQRLERSTKPEDREKAAVLKEAIKKASDSAINTKFDKLISLLRDNKSISLNEIKDAMVQSNMLANDIRELIDLLLSDNREAQLKAERKRIEALMKMLEAVIRQQKIVRAQTEAGQLEKNALSKSQQKVTESTKQVAKAMGGKDSESKNGKGSDSKNGKNDSKDKKGGDSKGDSQGKQGQQSQSGQQNSGDQSGKQTPGKEDVEQAIRKQRQAEENLEQAKRDQASNKQDQAIKDLENARKRLEEILRQLREEEMQRLLAALEARCRQMLAMQIEVYEGTVRVDKTIAQIPDRKPAREEEQRSLQLSDREQQIVALANKAIQILENEGSAVAFPEVFTQVRDDMVHVARRLGRVDVGPVTQTIEQDIINTLKEMIEALKKAQANKSGGGQSQAGSQPPNPSLIDILAELKMIRSLQIRVNSRTLTYARQYTGEQANDPDIQRELNDLAQRQQKIFNITNDIARGKNR